MDVKNTFIGLLFLAAAGYVMYTSANQQTQIQSAQEYTQAVSKSEAENPAREVAMPEVLADAKDNFNEEISVLEN